MWLHSETESLGLSTSAANTTNAIFVHSVVIEELCEADIKSMIDTLSISSFIFSMS